MLRAEPASLTDRVGLPLRSGQVDEVQFGPSVRAHSIARVTGAFTKTKYIKSLDKPLLSVIAQRNFE